MNLAQLCQLADVFYIAENKKELDQHYIASSEIIFTDGKNKHHIDADGYICIKDIDNANYIIFLDQDGNIYLGIYKYIQESKYKEIVDGLHHIREQLGLHKHARTHINTPEEEAEKPPEPMTDRRDHTNESIISDDLVDINNPICEECGSTEFNTPFIYNSKYEIECVCSKCGIQYTLVPSKYYIIKSKTIYKPDNPNSITATINKSN